MAMNKIDLTPGLILNGVVQQPEALWGEGYANYRLNFSDEYIEKSKILMYDAEVNNFINSLMSQVEIEGLIDTVPERELILLLLRSGYATFVEVPDKGVFSLFGLPGGIRNEHQIPTRMVITSPYLGFSKDCVIDEDCIVVPNDSMYQGVLPVIAPYINLLVENKITMLRKLQHSRSTYALTASSDSEYNSAKKFINDVEAGKGGVIASQQFSQGQMNSLPFGVNSSITENIEIEQYLKIAMLNKFGINGNYNMKREAINSNESQLNEDGLMPLVENMIETWNKGFEKVAEKYGEKYGLRPKAKLRHVWALKELEEELQEEIIEDEIENVDSLEDSGEPIENDNIEKEDIADDKTEASDE